MKPSSKSAATTSSGGGSLLPTSARRLSEEAELEAKYAWDAEDLAAIEGLRRKLDEVPYKLKGEKSAARGS